MIRPKQTYTTDNSDLAITVYSVYKVRPDYTTLKGKIFNKRNGIVYEVRTYRKVPTKNLKFWKVLK